MKNKITKLKKKAPIILATGLILAGLGGGAYYLNNKQDLKEKDQQSESQIIPDSEVEKNVEEKSEATSGTTTTTPPVTAEKPAEVSLADVSIKVLLDFDKTQAYAYLLGPAGTYGVEKLVNGTWKTVIGSFDYIGRGGGYGFDTILSSDTETHYRVFLLNGDTRTATSGDTVITWQQILNNGTLTVPIVR